MADMGLRDAHARPLRDLRISVVDRCNFRCPYCMPEEAYPRDTRFLSLRERLSAAEIERLARVFVGLGVDKLRLTGGEPLLRRDLRDIVARLAAIDGAHDLALTTNGTGLAVQAAALRTAGLRRLTVSVDALDPVRFAEMSGGRGDVAEVLAGIAAARAAGFAPIKINTVVVRGRNDDQVLPVLEHFRGSGCIVRFIEYMDVGTCNGWRAEDVVGSAELIEHIAARWPLTPLPPTRDGEVASRYAYADGQGEVGFVSAVSAPFCGACNRARLSADGQFFTCLFATRGTDLREPLRAGASDAELAALITRVWRARTDRYSEARALAVSPPRRIEMFQIGG
jgi:cyclic pyranopterin phosphate synthase